MENHRSRGKLQIGEQGCGQRERCRTAGRWNWDRYALEFAFTLVLVNWIVRSWTGALGQTLVHLVGCHLTIGEMEVLNRSSIIALAGATITRKTTTFPTQHVSFNIIIFLFKNNLLRRILMYLIHFCMEILEPYDWLLVDNFARISGSIYFMHSSKAERLVRASLTCLVTLSTPVGIASGRLYHLLFLVHFSTLRIVEIGK
jgi:hypothetical protein